jgi:hypothetical protein
VAAMNTPVVAPAAPGVAPPAAACTGTTGSRSA